MGALASSGQLSAVWRLASGRLVSLTALARGLRICSASGAAPLHAFSVYASAGGTAAAASDCTGLLRAGLEAAAALGQVPALVAADVNQDPLPPTVAAAMALAGWRGLAEGLGPTSDGGRRIDRVYANPWAALLARSVCPP